jgi:putative transposase
LRHSEVCSVRQAVVYRLYPSKAQRKRLESIQETARRWYNACLAERKTAYEERRESVGKYAQLRQVKTLKANNPYAAGVHSHILQVVVDDLDKAFQAFFRRVKAGETPGYPRFKGRNRFRGFGFKEYGNGFKVDGRRLKLHGVGRVAVRWHRELPGEVKTLRLICKAGKWYAAFSCLAEPAPLPPTGDEIGLDVGLLRLLTTSNGDPVENPQWYRTEQRRLRVCQRRVARRKKSGANRRKAVLVLQRQHERITNRRRDFLYKLTHDLICQYDRIALEDLRIINMVRNPYLAKSILDSGWGLLAQHLMSKAESAGRVVSLINPAYTSKRCSACGHLFEDLTLADRWLNCRCGLSIDRDHNAAINILRAGQALWAETWTSGSSVAQEAAGL